MGFASNFPCAGLDIYGMQHNFSRWLVLTSAPIDLTEQFHADMAKIERAELVTL
jgi:hypothetical protein